MCEEEYIKDNFHRLAEIDSKVNELETVVEFITNSIGDVGAKKVSVDCDTESKIVNVCYLFLNGIIVSISKPLETMDDGFVVFNAYHNRKLILTEITTIPFIKEYMSKITLKI